MRHCPCANKQKRRHFHAKTTSAKLYIHIGVGSRDLFIDEAHKALGIFPVFFPCMLPTPLCGILKSDQWFKSYAYLCDMLIYVPQVEFCKYIKAIIWVQVYFFLSQKYIEPK